MAYNDWSDWGDWSAPAWNPVDQEDSDLGAAMTAASARGNGSWVSDLGRAAETVSSTVARLYAQRSDLLRTQAAAQAADYRARRSADVARYQTDAAVEIERIRAQSLARRRASEAGLLPGESPSPMQAAPWLLIAVVGAGALALYAATRR